MTVNNSNLPVITVNACEMFQEQKSNLKDLKRPSSGTLTGSSRLKVKYLLWEHDPIFKRLRHVMFQN